MSFQLVILMIKLYPFNLLCCVFLLNVYITCEGCELGFRRFWRYFAFFFMLYNNLNLCIGNELSFLNKDLIRYYHVVFVSTTKSSEALSLIDIQV